MAQNGKCNSLNSDEKTLLLKYLNNNTIKKRMDSIWFNEEDLEDFNKYNDAEKLVDRIKLRTWQIKAKKYYKKECNGKAIFESSTGSGKTFFAINLLDDLLKENPEYKTLIVVPKNVILETGWYKELTDYGFNIQDIGVYYGFTKEYGKVTITNIQNFHKIALQIFDVLILDEIHNMATKRLLELVKTPFKHKIGLTATLKRQDNKHVELLKIFDYNVYKYNAKQALNDEVLNPFDFYNISIDMDAQTKILYDDYTQTINKLIIQNGSYSSLMKTQSPAKFKLLSIMNDRKKLVNNYEEKSVVVNEIINNNKNKKIIIFNQFNEQTNKLYWQLLESGNTCRVVHSSISKEQREQNLIDFKNDKYNVLLTSKVLDEGYNLPKLDLAIIMAGDSSDRQTIQRMGRVLRKKENSQSQLFQLYCKDTIEESSAVERSKKFKSLSSTYKDIHHLTGTKTNIYTK